MWNCRVSVQPQHTTTIQSLREYSCSHRSNIIFLSEVKTYKISNISFITSSLGFKHFHLVPSVGKFEGLVLLWKNDVNIQITIESNCLIHCLIADASLPNSWHYSFVYNPHVASLKPSFWNLLNEVVKAFFGLWILMEDFNLALDQKDKCGGKSVVSSSRCGFRNMLNLNGLIDLGFISYLFTWNNHRLGKANIRERLDHAFANRDWKVMYPSTIVTLLLALNSDHKPLLVNASLLSPNRLRPFLFESMWIKDASIDVVIEYTFPTLSHFMTKLNTPKLLSKSGTRKFLGMCMLRFGT